MEERGESVEKNMGESEPAPVPQATTKRCMEQEKVCGSIENGRSRLLVVDEKKRGVVPETRWYQIRHKIRPP